jgi:hypothetical protein
VRPFFLALEPSLIYTLIGLWCKSMLKMLLIVFFKLLFLENYKMLGDLWRTLSPFPSCFMVFILLFTTNMGNMKRGSLLLIIFRHKARCPPRWSFICLGPNSSIPKGHYTSPQLCLSILDRRYPHCGPYEWSCSCLWPPFDLISPS